MPESAESILESGAQPKARRTRKKAAGPRVKDETKNKTTVLEDVIGVGRSLFQHTARVAKDAFFREESVTVAVTKTALVATALVVVPGALAIVGALSLLGSKAAE